MGEVASLPVSFYLELALIVPLGVAVFVAAGAIQRAQQRRAYQNWRGWSRR